MTGSATSGNPTGNFPGYRCAHPGYRFAARTDTKGNPMCYRPRPDFERRPAKRPTDEEIDRRFERLKAELALLRKQKDRALKA